MKKKIDASAAIILIVAAAFSAFAAAFFILSWRGSDESKLDEAMDVIEKYYVGEYSREDIEDSAISAMIESLGDRWSYYLPEDEVEGYFQTMNNQYSGIGVTIEQKNGEISIVAVQPDSPAAQAGLLPGGIIRTVNGASTEEMTSADLKSAIQAGLEAGSVELGVEYDGSVATCTVEQGLIEIDPVRFELLDDGIGYVKVKNFEARCADQIKTACEELAAQGARGLVFDLRFNPGGQLSELISALDYILPEGVIFISETKSSGLRENRSDAACVELPMAVLVNEDSYSAAEFFAAALQEYDWATVVGTKTTGKGYAQITELLSDGSAIHISSKKYYTPSGASLADTGVTPDVQVELDEAKWAQLYYDLLDHADDEQLQAALSAVHDAMAD